MRFHTEQQQRRFTLTHIHTVPEAGCWLWAGATCSKGYGRILPSRHRAGQRAHRYFYEQLVGPIPDGLVVCHKCDTPLCVNPDHLFAGTQKENISDRNAKGRAAYGNTNYPKKLTDGKVREILRSKATKAVLAKRFNVSEGLITAVRGGRVWKHIHTELNATQESSRG